MKTWKLLGLGAVIAAAVTALVLITTSGGSVTTWVRQNYTKAPQSVSEGHDAAYISTANPGVTADTIARAWKPAQRLDNASGSFLRYSNVIIAVAAEKNSDRAVVFVDNTRRGYNHWYPYVGYYWGSSNGSNFRGGGPGAGK